MEQNSLPPPGPQEEGHKETTHHKPTNEGNPHPVEHDPSSDKNGGHQTEPSVLGFLVGDSLLCFLFEGLSYFFESHNAPLQADICFCLFLATIVAGITFGVWKFWSKPKPTKRICSIASLVWLALIIMVARYEKPVPAHAPPASSPPQVLLLMPQPIAQPKIAMEPLAFREKHESISLILGNGLEIGLPAAPPKGTITKDIGRAFLGMAAATNSSQFGLIASESQIICNIKFVPAFGMPPLVLTNNEIGGLPSDWDCNHSANGIEVVNEDLVPIFQLYYKNDTHIVINGAITYANGSETGVVLISESDGLRGRHVPTHLFEEIKALKLKRLFKYPAWKYPGQFAVEKTDPHEYELLAPSVVSNIVQTLREPSGRANTSFVLIHPVNPDESAYALAEQLKLAFSDGGYVVGEGTPPSDIPEIPGISCFVYGYAIQNTGLWSALDIILDATKSRRGFRMMPIYRGVLTPADMVLGNPKSMGEIVERADRIYAWSTNQNSVVVIMIRKK